MKREILFRGFSTDSNQWVYGFYREYPIYQRCGTCLDHINYFIDLVGGGSEFVKPETVGQFIGLLTKCGDKIFDGDIIGGKGLVGLVEYNTQLTQFQCTWTKYNGSTAGDIHSLIYLYDDEYSVIGNIHDNPELLTEKKQYDTD